LQSLDDSFWEKGTIALNHVTHRPSETHFRWFYNTMRHLKEFYLQHTWNMTGVYEGPTGDVYADGRPVAPGSHFHRTTTGATNARDRRRLGRDSATAYGDGGNIRKRMGTNYSDDESSDDEYDPALDNRQYDVSSATLTVSTTNVGYSIQGLGHRLGVTPFTPLGKLMSEVRASIPNVAAIQEHKLGPHDFGHLPGISDEKWFWLGFPGPKRGQQGLGFLIKKGSAVLFTRHDRGSGCEVATLVVRCGTLTITVVNTYWDSKGAKQLSNIASYCETVWDHIREAEQFGSDATYLVGDLNVDMMRDSACSRAVDDFVHTRLHMTRQDVQGVNRTWATRPRSSSHLDCVAFKTKTCHKLLDYWNREWAGDDHTTLGVCLSMQNKHVEPVKSKKENNNQPLKYNYKECSKSEIAAYAATLECLAMAGLKERLYKDWTRAASNHVDAQEDVTHTH
jgi:hypothetical protein